MQKINVLKARLILRGVFWSHIGVSSQLKNLRDNAETPLREAAHATSGASDVSRLFENELTKSIGTISANVFKAHQQIFLATKPTTIGSLCGVR
jgi:hypothetical protein